MNAEWGEKKNIRKYYAFPIFRFMLFLIKV